MRAKPTQSRPEPGWLTKQQMVASCGITPTAFDKWGVDPVGRIGRHVYYRVADVISNRLARQAMNAAAEAGKRAADTAPVPAVIEAEREKLLLTREQRIGQELKNAQTRRELAPVAALEWALSNLASQIVAQLDAVPLRMKKLYPSWGARQIEDLNRELIKSRNAVSEASLNLDDYLDRDPEGD